MTRSAAAGVAPEWIAAVDSALALVGDVTMRLAALGMAGQVEDMLRHSVDYLDLFATVAIAWQWMLQAAVAREGLAKSPSPLVEEFYQGKVCAAEYWIKTELPRVEQLARLCASDERSYARMQSAWF
jgi:butyryl-CoA dehydrogenase